MKKQFAILLISLMVFSTFFGVLGGILADKNSVYAADTDVSISASDTSVTVGDDVTFDVEVTNTAEEDNNLNNNERDISVSIDLPGFDTDEDTSWDVTLGPGESDTHSVTATADESGTFTIEADAGGASDSVDVTVNSKTEETTTTTTTVTPVTVTPVTTTTTTTTRNIYGVYGTINPNIKGNLIDMSSSGVDFAALGNKYGPNIKSVLDSAVTPEIEKNDNAWLILYGGPNANSIVKELGITKAPASGYQKVMDAWGTGTANVIYIFGVNRAGTQKACQSYANDLIKGVPAAQLS
jgi:hypothetical protein